MIPWQAGMQLGPYELLSPIGSGGMGEVWKARDSRLDRIVAIKRLKAEHAERFKREARAIAALNHPHICQIYDVGADFLVMEYIDGAPIRCPLAAEEAVRLAIQIASALEEAHSKGIIHRDLKPGNILITQKGETKLLDFGLAKLEEPSPRSDTFSTLTVGLTEVGAVVGTGAYLSPEQAQGQPVDARSDIFSFGLVLYEILSGRRAFAGETAFATMSSIVRDEPPPLQAPAAVESIVIRCLEKLPAKRFQNMAEVEEALRKTTQTGTSVIQQPSIAVLPFANMSGDKEQEYFSDGLAEEIINALANSTGIRVIARTSAFAFKGQNTDVRKIAEALGVVNILEGSVRKAGNRIRVMAQLITAADGSHLWSQRFDRDLEDVFAIQDEISQAIAATLRVKLSPAPRAYVPRADALEALLKGRHHLFKPTPESMALSRQCFEKAIELDPGFALAHAELGRYYFALSYAMPARETMPLARAAALRAIEIDASLPEAHAMLGCIAGVFEYDWTEAKRQFGLAMGCQTVPPGARQQYGFTYLLPLGRPLAAAREIELAVQDDPLNSIYVMHLALCLDSAGKREEASERLRQALELNERNWIAHLIHSYWLGNEGRVAEALRAAERALAIAPWSPAAVGIMARALALSGDTPRATELLQQLGSGEALGVPGAMVGYYLLLQDFEKAAGWAEKAIEQRDLLIPCYLQFSMARELRSSAYWPKLAKLMNLPEPG